MEQQEQAVFILKMDENGRKLYSLESDGRKRYHVANSESHELLEGDDPEMAEFLCKRIKLERPDLGSDSSIMEEVEESVLPNGDCIVQFHSEHGMETIEPDHQVAGADMAGLFGEVVMGVDEMPNSELVLEQAEEVVSSLGHSTEPLSELEDREGSSEEEESDVLMQHMDIREPLSTLRSLLEQRIGVDLSDYQFWLQDGQRLEGHMNLVEQCVQGEGLVQVNVQIKTDGDVKKINIVDVLKPAEEYVEVAEDPLDDAQVQKNTTQATEPKQNVIRWVVDSQFKKDQEKLKIPKDPNDWSVAHVRHWLQWAVRTFNLVGVRLTDWNMNGKKLCQLTMQEFQQKVPLDPGSVFWTHLELLRKCKLVVVIQKQPDEPQIPKEEGMIRGRQSKQPKLGKLPRIIGLPLKTMELTCCGNRTGNNGQIQLWQFLLELLTDKNHRDVIQWLGDDGEFKLNHPEMVAQLWGERKNKPTMNYEKLSRALRYYYDGDMIAKVHGKRFVYKFVCNLKELLGYSASELNRLVEECARKGEANSRFLR